MKPILLALPFLLHPTMVFGEPLEARDTADILPFGGVQIGIFNPLRLGLGRVELELHPLQFFVAPHVDARVELARLDALRASGIAGIGVPTGGFRLSKPLGLRGDLVPSCKVTEDEPARADTCDAPPWVVVLKLGVILSLDLDWGGASKGTFTLKTETSKGLPVSGEPARPLDAWAPITVKLAPALGQWKTELSAAWDMALIDALRMRVELSGYYLDRPSDDPLSSWFTSVHLSSDLRTSEHTRLSLGVIWWTADKHEREVAIGADGFAEVRYVRSHEFWPTFDFLWRY